MLAAQEIIDFCPKALRFTLSEWRTNTRKIQLIRDHAPALENMDSILKVVTPRRKKGSFYTKKLKEYKKDTHLIVSNSFFGFP